MLSRWARRWSPQLFHPLVCRLLRLGVTANGLTAAGLLLALLSGVCIALNQLPLAASCLALSGLLDALDGELARQASTPSRLGPFIDSIADHYGDFAIYLGLVWRAVGRNDDWTIFLVMAAMFGSLVGSHIRSRAGIVGIETKNVGVFTRMERNLVLIAALVSGWIAPALGLLAFASNLSALQRLIYTMKADR